MNRKSPVVIIPADDHREIVSAVTRLRKTFVDLQEVFRCSAGQSHPAFLGTSAAVAETERILFLLQRTVPPDEGQADELPA